MSCRAGNGFGFRGWLARQGIRVPLVRSKLFPFSGDGLGCSHAVIRYRQPGQLDGNRERREHRQEGTGQPLRFQREQSGNRLEKNEIKLSAENPFKLKALAEIVIGKIAKRNISLKSVEQCEPEVSPLGHARQLIKIKQGIATEVAKQVTGFIRESKFKVTTQIQDQQVRVTGKSRDDLQAVIAAVRAKDFPVALQFTNFRD